MLSTVPFISESCPWHRGSRLTEAPPFPEAAISICDFQNPHALLALNSELPLPRGDADIFLFPTHGPERINDTNHKGFWEMSSAYEYI